MAISLNVKNDFYLMNIGRLGSATYARDIILDFSLPVSIAFEESTTPDLVNAKNQLGLHALHLFCIHFMYLIM